MRTEFNGCKTFDCPNLGNANLVDYQPSNQLGYDAFKCAFCGSLTPVLDDRPINALSGAILESNVHDMTLCKKCGHHTLTRHFGLTRSGSPRRQCTHCLSVVSLVNPNKSAELLDPLYLLIREGRKPREIRQALNLNSKSFYARLSQLSELLKQVNYQLLKAFTTDHTKLALSTYTNTFTLRSEQALHTGVKVWNITTSDVNSGVIILNSDNLLRIKEFKYGLYDLDRVEQQDKSLVGFEAVQATYDKIFARHKFDNLAYANQSQTQTGDGVIIRPVYAAHAHFKSLRGLIPLTSSLRIYLEHESFVRGAAITNFSEQVKQGDCHLDYLYPRQSLPLVKTLESSKKVGWWNETWYIQTQPKDDNNVAFQLITAPLTGKCPPTLSSKQSSNTFSVLNGFEKWFTAAERRRLSYHRFQQWLTIYITMHNIDKVSNERRDTPFTSIKSLVAYLL